MKTSTLTLCIVGVVALLWGAEASVFVSKVAPLQENTSCAGRCNQTGTIPGAPCQCNAYCQRYNDCCADYYELCLDQTPGSCAGKCDTVGTDPGAPCQCNKPCVDFGDCCPDYEDVCSGGQGPITNAEIAALTEELYELEGPNNAYRYIQVSSLAKQGFNSSDGISPLDLLTVDPAAYELETIKKLIALFDNYAPQVCTAEIFTSEQQQELDDFIDAVFATPIMQRTQEFLSSKGLPSGRSNFVQAWIDQYSRCSGTKGSSGLEHILMGELNNGVSGFHNWVFFAKGEEAGDVVYRSATDFIEFGDKGAAIEFGFTWLGANKPVSSIYIGTSPELELALTTVAYYARPNSKCPVSLNGKTIQIQTYDISQNGMKYVASGYPDLSN